MTDREDFNLGKSEAVCKGSFALGNACGRCSRCRDEALKMNSKSKFSVKVEKLGSDVIAGFRVRPEAHKEIKRLAEENGLGISAVVRLMIDFALDNL